MEPITPDIEDAPAPNRRVLLYGLVGLTALAGGLLIVKARQRPPLDVLDHASWQESIHHLANNLDYRFAGIENRLNIIEGRDVVAHAATPAAEVASPVPADEGGPSPVAGMNGTVVDRVPPTLADEGLPTAPPAPAAVSIPPGQ